MPILTTPLVTGYLEFGIRNQQTVPITNQQKCTPQRRWGKGDQHKLIVEVH
jgi:hypothetical protein